MRTHFRFPALTFTAAALAAGAALSVGAPRTVHAQWGVGMYGVAETDTDEVRFFLLGLSTSPSGYGWKPTLGVQGYHLSYKSGSERNSVRTFTPSAGIQYSFSGGSTQFKLGYQFRSSDAPETDTVIVGEATGGRDGVVASFQHEYWGTGALGYQALASYNFEGESFFGRGRVTAPLARMSSGNFRVGAEAGTITSPRYTSPFAGGVLIWQMPRGGVGLGVGRRFGDADATYFRLEFYTSLL